MLHTHLESQHCTHIWKRSNLNPIVTSRLVNLAEFGPKIIITLRPLFKDMNEIILEQLGPIGLPRIRIKADVGPESVQNPPKLSTHFFGYAQRPYVFVSGNIGFQDASMCSITCKHDPQYVDIF